MIKSSLVKMELSCVTNKERDDAIILANIATEKLYQYLPISAEMRANKQHAVALLHQVQALLTEYI